MVSFFLSPPQIGGENHDVGFALLLLLFTHKIC